MDDLAPPRKSVELEDPGAHELGSSSENEHFSDASEGQKATHDRSGGTSPIPMTRVERVDDQPSYGEVPGTQAYNTRTQDAVPDEVAIVPEGMRSRSSSGFKAEDRPTTPGGTPVPKTVVEMVDPDTPSHGDVPGTEAYEMRKADAAPDLVLQAPDAARRPLEGSPTASMNRSQPNSQPNHEREGSLDQLSNNEEVNGLDTGFDDKGNRDDDGFGDDFDDFEEGGGDDDFGDFDDGFQQVEGAAETLVADSFHQSSESVPQPSLPLLDFDNLHDLDDILAASKPYLDELFPARSEQTTPNDAPDVNPSILSERSLSLWSQLVAPPPLQPPNWIRSRIRRLFLVSLGVPVDLDEILPASKQKKLVLPSMSTFADKSPQYSSDERANGAVARIKQGNDSTASVNSSASKAERKRRGPPPPPELDISSTRMLCSTTDAALSNLTDEELKEHVKRLEELRVRANEVLEYWLKRKDSALGDKEAFEGVIENLVKHAKKIRK